MAPILAAIVGTLLQNGLPQVANAVIVKGSEWLEEKTGVKLDAPLSDESVEKIKQFALDNARELAQIQLENNKLAVDLVKADDARVAQQWQSDMASDSWLSKNIRPGALAAVLGATFLFAIGSAFEVMINEAFVKMYASWGEMMLMAYFGGRSIEKIVEILQRKHATR